MSDVENTSISGSEKLKIVLPLTEVQIEDIKRFVQVILSMRNCEEEHERRFRLTQSKFFKQGSKRYIEKTFGIRGSKVVPGTSGSKKITVGQVTIASLLNALGPYDVLKTISNQKIADTLHAVDIVLDYSYDLAVILKWDNEYKKVLLHTPAARGRKEDQIRRHLASIFPESEVEFRPMDEKRYISTCEDILFDVICSCKDRLEGAKLLLNPRAGRANGTAKMGCGPKRPATQIGYKVR